MQASRLFYNFPEQALATTAIIDVQLPLSPAAHIFRHLSETLKRHWFQGPFFRSWWQVPQKMASVNKRCISPLCDARSIAAPGVSKLWNLSDVHVRIKTEIAGRRSGPGF
jgi:hypothetical protein